MRTTVPNISKESDTSYPFTLPFLLAFSWFSCDHPFTLMEPTKLVNYDTLPLSSLKLAITSFESFIPCWVPHYTSRFPSNFLFPNQFPRHTKHNRKEQETNKKKILKTNKNTTPQTKWHDHALDIMKLQIKCKKMTRHWKIPS